MYDKEITPRQAAGFPVMRQWMYHYRMRMTKAANFLRIAREVVTLPMKTTSFGAWEGAFRLVRETYEEALAYKDGAIDFQNYHHARCRGDWYRDCGLAPGEEPPSPGMGDMAWALEFE